MKHDLQVFVRRRDPKRMRNGPIQWFRSFKWRNRAQNRNLWKKKLSKIGPTENFHLSQKSKSIVKDSKSLLKSTKANVAKKRWRDTNWTNRVWHAEKFERMMCRWCTLRFVWQLAWWGWCGINDVITMLLIRRRTCSAWEIIQAHEAN